MPQRFEQNMCSSPDERLNSMLDQLASYYGLEAFMPTLRLVIATIGRDSLRSWRAKPDPNFSDINGNGVPVQFSVSLGTKGRALRFLGEVAGAGMAMPRRLALSSIRLQELVQILGLRSAIETVNQLFRELLPEDPTCVLQWRMGMWFAIGAAPGPAIALRVYLNQRWDTVVSRYQRFGRLLASLGRHNDLNAWCNIAPIVSAAAIPFGVSFDIVPGGLGRLKVYLASQGATRLYWERLLTSLGLCHQFALLERLSEICRLDLDNVPNGVISPSLEFTDEANRVGLKLDFSCNQIGASDRQIDQYIMTYARECGINADEYREVLTIVAPGSLRSDRIASIQYCGIGFRDLNSHRLNVYLCPDLFSFPPARIPTVSEFA